MTVETTLRALIIAFAFPNTALFLVLAYHFRVLGADQPAGSRPLVDAEVFSWATILYIGAAVLDATMSYRLLAVFRDPFNVALPLLFVGQAISTVGLVGLLRSLAVRSW